MFLVICAVSLLASGLTFFSGFGLGTLLMPVFALFFPVSVAIAATAVVHLANNIFKAVLIGRNANWSVVLRFALPGAIAAMFGAWLLTFLQGVPPILSYQLGNSVRTITPIGIVVGILIICFSLFDLLPSLEKISFDKKFLPLGGLLSGFFGGISGHQGALRSAFLVRTGLPKEAFIGTGVISAVIVDVFRLGVYGVAFYSTNFNFNGSHMWLLVGAACLSAFTGAFMGKKLLKKITMRTVQTLVGSMLLLLGIGLGIGLI